MSSKTRTKSLYSFQFVRIARHNHLAYALYMTVIKAGKSVYRTTLADLVDNLAKVHNGGQLNQKLRQLSRPALLIVDEI